MSRDVLRGKAVKLGLMKYGETKKLTKSQLMDAIRKHHNQPAKQSKPNLQLGDVFPFENSVFSEYKEFKDGVVKETVYVNETKTSRVKKFFQKIKSQVLNDISTKPVKVHFNLCVTMEMPDSGEEIAFYFQTKTMLLLPDDDREEFYLNVRHDLANRIQEQEQSGSGWSLMRVEYLTMTQNQYKAFRGKSYLPLPKWIADKKAIINVQNKDNKCFMWALLSALHPVNQDAERTTKYKQFESKLDFG